MGILGVAAPTRLLRPTVDPAAPLPGSAARPPSASARGTEGPGPKEALGSAAQDPRKDHARSADATSSPKPREFDAFAGGRSSTLATRRTETRIRRAPARTRRAA